MPTSRHSKMKRWVEGNKTQGNYWLPIREKKKKKLNPCNGCIIFESKVKISFPWGFKKGKQDFKKKQKKTDV